VRVAVLHGSNDTYGASRVLLEDCAALVELGHQVEVCLPFSGPLSGQLRAAGVTVTEAPLHVLRLSDRKSLLKPPTQSPAWQQRPDLTVLWTLALMSYLPVLRARRDAVLVSVHELIPSRLGGLLARATRGTTGLVQVNSTAVAGWLTACGVPPSRLSLAYPSAPPHRPSAPRPDDGTVQVGLLGRVNGSKGHLEAVNLVESARRLSGVDIRLTTAGGPFHGQERHLQALRSRLDGVDFARHLGEVNDVRAVLEQLDLLLIWSQKPESFGITALEAWAAGRRCVSNGAGGAAEAAWLVDGVVLPADADGQAAEALAWVVRQPTLISPPLASAPASVLATPARRAASWQDLLMSVLPAAREPGS